MTLQIQRQRATGGNNLRPNYLYQNKPPTPAQLADAEREAAIHAAYTTPEGQANLLERAFVEAAGGEGHADALVAWAEQNIPKDKLAEITAKMDQPATVARGVHFLQGLRTVVQQMDNQQALRDAGLPTSVGAILDDHAKAKAGDLDALARLAGTPLEIYGGTGNVDPDQAFKGPRQSMSFGDLSAIKQ